MRFDPSLLTGCGIVSITEGPKGRIEEPRQRVLDIAAKIGPQTVAAFEKAMDAMKPKVAADRLFFLLPIPPSVNNLYANVKGIGRVPTKGHAAWKTRADCALWEQKVSGRFDGPCRVVVTITGGKGFPMSRDIDNTLKAVLDFVVAKKIVRADNVTCITEATARFVAGKKGTLAACSVLIEAIGPGVALLEAP